MKPTAKHTHLLLVFQGQENATMQERTRQTSVTETLVDSGYIQGSLELVQPYEHKTAKPPTWWRFKCGSINQSRPTHHLSRRALITLIAKKAQYPHLALYLSSSLTPSSSLPKQCTLWLNSSGLSIKASLSLCKSPPFEWPLKHLFHYLTQKHCISFPAESLTPCIPYVCACVCVICARCVPWYLLAVWCD